MAMKMNFIDLKQQYLGIKDEVRQAVDRVLDSTQFIMGPDVAEFEKEMAAFCGTKQAVACASGTDALLIPLMAAIKLYFGVAMIPVSLGLALFIMFLEVLVAFIQAYIFTLLTAIFIGMNAHPAH